MKVSNHQIDLMKHTVSDPKRNWFGTSYGCKDSDEFEKLVKGGYAVKQNAPSWMGDDVIYRLTETGKELVNKL